MFKLGSHPPPETGVSARTIVSLLALEDFYRQLPALNAKRADIQRRRRVADANVLRLFGDPFHLHEGGRYEEVRTNPATIKKATSKPRFRVCI